MFHKNWSLFWCNTLIYFLFKTFLLNMIKEKFWRYVDQNILFIFIKAKAIFLNKNLNNILALIWKFNDEIILNVYLKVLIVFDIFIAESFEELFDVKYNELSNNANVSNLSLSRSGESMNDGDEFLRGFQLDIWEKLFNNLWECLIFQ